MVHAGDWRSSVASAASLGVRFAHPRAWSTAEAIAQIDEVVASVCDRVGVSYTLTPTGYRAEGHYLDPESWLVRSMQAAHAAVHGERCDTFVLGTTTDARYYVNVAGVPALCYGPVARRIHGTDEAVELDSIVRGAKTLALFLARHSAGAHDGEARGPVKAGLRA
jgi:acetylornithine deacetylase